MPATRSRSRLIACHLRNDECEASTALRRARRSEPVANEGWAFPAASPPTSRAQRYGELDLAGIWAPRGR
jgi:hypothetical protein